jgi:amidohydrolase
LIHSKILDLRKELHKYPELSGKEVETARRIKTFIDSNYPTKIIENIGGFGLAAVYDYGEGGSTIAFRCELDALPIEEENTFEYRSTVSGISHKCGHDGHMAILAGLVLWLKQQSFKRGKVVLLFQPAEETGKGAAKVMQDERFRDLQIDYIFALHNIPGLPLKQVVLTQNSFSAEVQSFSVHLTGKESHAAEPEHGINPAYALAEIVKELKSFNVDDPANSRFAVLTPVHLSLGQKSYGISPARGELHYTIRTWNGREMDLLVEKIKSTVRKVCAEHSLSFTEEWFEHFPASINNENANQIIMDAADANGFELFQRTFPFKFGEDFGWFSKDFKTAMFGLGSGLSSPALHNPDYDFPDQIIETGVSMFGTLAHLVLDQDEQNHNLGANG